MPYNAPQKTIYISIVFTKGVVCGFFVSDSSNSKTVASKIFFDKNNYIETVAFNNYESYIQALELLEFYSVKELEVF